MDIITITNRPDGSMQIERRLPFVTRALAVFALGIVATRIAYSLRWNINNFRALDPPEEWATFAPGFALLAFGVLAFALLACVIAIRRPSLILDPTTRRMTAIANYRLFRRRREIPFSRAKSVKTFLSGHRGRSPHYVVQVVLDTGRTVHVGKAETQKIANDLQRQLSKILGVPRSGS